MRCRCQLTNLKIFICLPILLSSSNTVLPTIIIFFIWIHFFGGQFLHLTGFPSFRLPWHFGLHSLPKLMQLQRLFDKQSFKHLQNFAPPISLYIALAVSNDKFFLKLWILGSICITSAVICSAYIIWFLQNSPSKYPCREHTW